MITLLSTLEHQTMLISTHDMHLVKELCTLVIVMDGGCVVAQSATAEILHDQDLMERHGLEVPRAGIVMLPIDEKPVTFCTCK